MAVIAKANRRAKTETVVEPKGPSKVKTKVHTTTQKKLEPKPWQKIVEENGKQKLVNQIIFMGKPIEYNGDFRAEYKWGNLKPKDGLTRIVTARFPKSESPDTVEEISYMGYKIIIEKFGNSAVCELSDSKSIILKYVSLATVIDVLQDLLNPCETCDIPWGTIDQSIKLKRGLKSRIKNLDENDLPAGKRKAKVESTDRT